MKIRSGKFEGGLFGTRVIGLLYDELYDGKIAGLVFLNYGIFITWSEK